MTPDEIKALRKELRCTPRELAETLGLELKVVMAWEADNMFPTKRFIKQMEELREKGMGAIVRKRRRLGPDSPWKVLADPEVWTIIRKLIAHQEFREQVQKLAAAYDEPDG